ncbi:hypothetical protein, partial [Phascolarctobacterium succinatutens]|uniref:hypothetical protein n=1 Tax=Phascolarctobacterium succinatutens TaxID=626940 RepID=UPI003AEF56E4
MNSNYIVFCAIRTIRFWWLERFASAIFLSRLGESRLLLLNLVFAPLAPVAPLFSVFLLNNQWL